jgi:hypothetical protein
MQEPGPPGWGSLRWDNKVWLRVLRDSDNWVIALQIADPSARKRGRPHRNKTANFRQQHSERKQYLGARYQDILTDWPSVVKQLRTSNSMSYCLNHWYRMVRKQPLYLCEYDFVHSVRTSRRETNGTGTKYPSSNKINLKYLLKSRPKWTIRKRVLFSI